MQRLKPSASEATADVSTLMVETAHCVPLRLQVEHEGAPLREFSGAHADLAEDQGRWYLRKGRMRDHQRQVETSIELGELRGFGEIPGVVFSRTDFYRACFGTK